MKIKSIPNNNSKKYFFIFMIVPLLIGFLISLTSASHAEWNTHDDPLLNKSPKKQGWKQIQPHRSSSVVVF